MLRHFAWTCESQPNAPAVVYRAYSEHPAGTVDAISLFGSAHGVAQHLQSLGVRPGEPVGLFADLGASLISAAVGIIMAGAVYVPMEPFVPDARSQVTTNPGGQRTDLT